MAATKEFTASAVELERSFRSGALSPVSALTELLGRIEKINPLVGAFYHVDAERALAQARASESRWLRGEPRSALDGVSVCIKDHIFVQGMPVRWGTRFQSIPKSNSCVVDRLTEAGAIIVGKTTMAELGYYASGVNSGYAVARNPWELSKTPGGSSSGAAAAVAAGLTPIAIGSDGGGSIRMPASFSGLVGFKPSGGRVPTFPSHGLNPVIGPLTRSVRDAALTMDIIVAPDRRDLHAVPCRPDGFVERLQEFRAGRRAAYIPDIGYGEPVEAGVARCVEDSVKRLAAAGLHVESLPPIFDDNLYNAVADAILPNYCQRFLDVSGGKANSLLPWTQETIKYSHSITIDQYVSASRKMANAITSFGSLFEIYDYVLTPTMTRTAFGASDPFPTGSRLNRYGYGFEFASFVYIANLTALPACSVPCGMDNDLPVGLQIIGRRFDELGIFQVAACHEQLSDPLVFPDLVAEPTGAM